MLLSAWLLRPGSICAIGTGLPVVSRGSVV